MHEADPALAVIGRCTGPAWERLRAMRDQPHFDAVVAILIQKEGALSENDVGPEYGALRNVSRAWPLPMIRCALRRLMRTVPAGALHSGSPTIHVS